MKAIILAALTLSFVTVRADNFTLGQTGQLAQAGAKVELPGLVIHGGAEKFVEASGKVALTNGVLEFVAVEPGGRDYESLFTLACKPSALQFALLLIGCEPGTDPYGGMPTMAKIREMRGDPVQVEVEWELNGKQQRAPVAQFLMDRKTKKSPAKLEWYFAGSYFTKGLEGEELFLADSEQAHIALWLNPAIPVNVRGEFGNPYHGDDEGLEVNGAQMPPTGTPVKLIFRKR